MAVMVFGFSVANPKFWPCPACPRWGFRRRCWGADAGDAGADDLGGFNLAIIYTANISALALAWVLLQFGGPEAGIGALIWLGRGAGRRHAGGRGHGRRHRLYRRASDPCVAGDDDLPARVWASS